MFHERFFKMTKVNTDEFQKTFIGCCHAFGCVTEVEDDFISFYTFEDGDAEAIEFTLAEVGSEFVGLIDIPELG